MCFIEKSAQERNLKYIFFSIDPGGWEGIVDTDASFTLILQDCS